MVMKIKYVQYIMFTTMVVQPMYGLTKNISSDEPIKLELQHTSGTPLGI